eukprot:s1457_g23.t1
MEELSANTGAFMLSVAQAGHRRMAPSSKVLRSLEEFRAHPAPFKFQGCRERCGGYGQQRDLGLVAFKANQDAGRWEVAYALSMFPDPPSQAAQCVPGKDIERLVKSCCSVEPFSVTSASRRTPDLAARLAEVTEHVTRLSPHCDPYGPAFPGINMKEEDRHQAFNPYRSLDPERLKLSGRGQWDPAPFVEDSLYLALREPQSLLLPSVPWPDPSQVPSLQEDPEKVLALAKAVEDDTHRASADGDPITSSVLVPALETSKLRDTRAFAALTARLEPPARLYAGFGAIMQGDALGVEIATSARGQLLFEGGLLQKQERILGPEPFPLGSATAGLVQGLVIDDLFAISKKPLGSRAPSEATVAFAGSDAKDVWDAQTATCAGAEIDVSEPTRALGLGLVGSPRPWPKGIALAAIGLELCATTDHLHLSLLGSWTSCLLYRRPLMAVLQRSYTLDAAGVASPGSAKVVPLSRAVANEFVMLAALCPLMTADIAAPWSDTVYATGRGGHRLCLGLSRLHRASLDRHLQLARNSPSRPEES